MGRRTISLLVVTVVALSGLVAVAASPAGAITSECASGVYPATGPSQSNFKMRCIFDDADISTAITIHDYNFAGYHAGAARTVSVKSNASTGQLIGASGSFGSTDLGRTVTAAGAAQTCVDIKPRSFITAVSGGTTATVAPKPGKTTSTTKSVASVTSYAGRNFIAITAGTATFTACDVGRTITAGPGGTANKKITTFVNSKLVVISAAAASSATATATLSAVAWPVQVANSRSRSFVDTASSLVTGPPHTLTSAVAKFAAADIGAAISGTCTARGTTITAVSGNVATLSDAPVCTPAAGMPERTYSIGSAGTDGMGEFSTARELNGTVSGGNHFISAGAMFNGSDVGLPIVIAGVTHKITSVVSANEVVYAGTHANGAQNGVRVGVPTGTAPGNGNTAMQLSTLINLKPSLVPGSDPCSADTYEGATITGEWYNPGSYLTAGILGAAVPRPSNNVAEIVFPTSVTSFAALLVLEDGDSQESEPHYDLVFPLLPTSLAICETGDGATTAVDIGTAFTVLGTSTGTQKLPTGWGQPGTAIVRGIGGSDIAQTDTATLTLDPNGTPQHIQGTSCTIDPSFAFTTLAQAEACGY
jgi:hypothetical protein